MSHHGCASYNAMERARLVVHFRDVRPVICDSDPSLSVRKCRCDLYVCSTKYCACGRQCVGVWKQRHIKVRLIYVTVVTLQHLRCKFEHTRRTFLVIIDWILPAITLRGLVHCASCAFAIVSAIAIATTIAIVLDSVIALAIAFVIASAIAFAIVMAMSFAFAFAMDSAIALVDFATAFAIASALSFAIASLRLSSCSNGIQYKLGEQHRAGFERCRDAGALGYPASVGLGLLPVLWRIVSKA